MWVHGYIQGKQCKYPINKDLMLCKINNTNLMQLLTFPLQALGRATHNQLQGQWRAQVRIRHRPNIGLLYTGINQIKMW